MNEITEDEILEEEIQSRRNRVLDIDPVYIIFTSGSGDTVMSDYEGYFDIAE